MRYRDLMKKISFEEVSNHKGKKTVQVLEQELTALMNGYDPNALTKKELQTRDWQVGLTLRLLEETATKAEFRRIVNKIKRKLEPEAKRRNWRDIFSGWRRRNK